MTTCKYFQQGNCRSGQYCRFAHTYNVNYGENSNLTNKPGYKTVALAVAEEVLAVERGGQWLLSCFGPFKERPCIPGMEDLSPDEYHWEIYQAQKSGTVDQTKLQFQQLCEEMKAKLALLKNPTQEIVAMLDSLQKGGQENAFGASNSLTKPSNFSFATSQIAIPSTSASASNLFTSKPFNASNPFGGSTSTFGSAGSTTFGFSNPANTSVGSTFGSKPTFGSNPVFGGSSVKSPTSVFTGANQNTPSFGSPTSQNTSAFNSQSVFGQPPAFNTSTSDSTVFGRLQSTQSNAIFGGTTTPTNSVFGGATTAQLSSTSIFGGSQASSTPLFGGASQQPSTGIFGGTAVVGNTQIGSSSSPFAQPKSNMTFGGGPVFGGAPNFGAQANSGVFGGQSTFGSAPTSSNNVFGGTNATTATFGAIGQLNPGSFGSVAKSPTSTFGGAQNASPFGGTGSTPNTGPFGSATPTATSPFAPSTGPFGVSTVTSTPFAGSKPFGSIGQSIDTTTGFGAAPTQTASPFGTANATQVSPFGQASPFGSMANSSPFSNTNTTVTTTTTSNPFASHSQVVSSSPFGGSSLINQGSIFTSSQTTPFTNSPFLSKEMDIVDENAYTIEGHLTDDEKAMYLAKQFTLGKIPLKAPTKELC